MQSATDATPPMSIPRTFFSALGVGCLNYAKQTVKGGIFSFGLGKLLGHDFLKPFLVGSAANFCVILPVQICYLTGRILIGERSIYADKSMDNTSTILDRFRIRTWKVIKKIEDVLERIDSSVSHALGIRTKKELAERGVKIIDYSFKEFMRDLVSDIIFKTPYTTFHIFSVLSLIKASGYELIAGIEKVNTSGIIKISLISIVLGKVQELQLETMQRDLQNLKGDNNEDQDQQPVPNPT